MLFQKKHSSQAVEDLFYKPNVKDIIADCKAIITADFTDEAKQRDLMLLLEMLLDKDPYLKSIFDLRANLVSSYEHNNDDWSILSSDDKFDSDDLANINRQFASVFKVISQIPAFVESFGNSLIKVDVVRGKLDSTLPVKINLQRINNSDFAQDEDDKIKVFDNKNDDSHFANLITEDEVDEKTDNTYLLNHSNNYGGLLMTVAEYSLLLQNIIIQWANFLQKQQGVIAIKADIKQLAQDIPLLLGSTGSVDPTKPMHGVGGQIDIVLKRLMTIAEKIGQDVATTIPSSVDVQNLAVATGSSSEFELFQRSAQSVYEVKFLGQSTISGSGVSGSYGTGAGLKVMQTNTLNKEREDKSLVVEAVNNLLSYYVKCWKGKDYENTLYFEFRPESNEDIEMNLKILSKMQELGLEAETTKIYKMLGQKVPVNNKLPEVLKLGGTVEITR